MPDLEVHAGPSRLAAIELLESAGLPSSDLSDAHMRHFFYAGPIDEPLGIVGIEPCGPDALLRSLVVRADARGSGLGGALVAHAESHARSEGISTLYLLTATAEHFFAARGYIAAERAAAPATIRGTREFADICPVSSAFMQKRLINVSR